MIKKLNEYEVFDYYFKLSFYLEISFENRNKFEAIKH